MDLQSRYFGNFRDSVTLGGIWTRNQIGRKRCLSIFNDLIMESRVDCGMPSLAAAPEGPETLPFLSASAASIISFSWVESFCASGSVSGSDCTGRLDSQLSSTKKFSESQTMTERSMTFCNSRMLPGQA